MTTSSTPTTTKPTSPFHSYRNHDNPPFQPNHLVTLQWYQPSHIWRIKLTRKGAAYLREHYPNTTDEELLQQLGVPISLSTLHRIALKMHLHKSQEHKQRIQARAAKRAQAICIAFGLYEAQKGKPVPGHEKNFFKPGQSRLDRYGAEKEAAIVAKIKKTRAALIRRERLRILSGEPQRTHLRLTSNKYASFARHRLLRIHHYQLAPHQDDPIAPTTFTWDSHTTRRPILEERYATLHHFRFIPPLGDDALGDDAS